MTVYLPDPTTITWDTIYDKLGIKGFIDFVSSPSLQADLLAVKIVFIFFTILFLFAVIYFYIQSSYVQYHYLQALEFFSWQPYRARSVSKFLKRIEKRIKSGRESEYKLAIIEANDLLIQFLQENNPEVTNFEELANINKKKLPNFEELLSAHNIRNSLVYNPDYRLDLASARRILLTYEKAIRIMAID